VLFLAKGTFSYKKAPKKGAFSYKINTQKGAFSEKPPTLSKVQRYTITFSISPTALQLFRHHRTAHVHRESA
jgi:hypothetical protein